MKLRNCNPIGAVDLPLIGRQGDPIGKEGSGCLEPGEVFEVDDKTGKHLLQQVGNYEAVGAASKRAAPKRVRKTISHPTPAEVVQVRTDATTTIKTVGE